MATKKTTPPKKTAAPAKGTAKKTAAAATKSGSPAKGTAKKTAAAAKKTAPKAAAKKAPAKGKGASGKIAAPTPAGDLPEIVAIPFDLNVLDGLEERTVTTAIAPPTYFSVTLREASPKRFVHLIQTENNKGWVVLSLLGDAEGLGALRRLPGAGAWMRAVVHGEVRVLAADVPLLREEIAKFLGGHEPAPQQARPPYT